MPSRDHLQPELKMQIGENSDFLAFDLFFQNKKLFGENEIFICMKLKIRDTETDSFCPYNRFTIVTWKLCVCVFVSFIHLV